MYHFHNIHLQLFVTRNVRIVEHVSMVTVFVLMIGLVLSVRKVKLALTYLPTDALPCIEGVLISLQLCAIRCVRMEEHAQMAVALAHLAGGEFPVRKVRLTPRVWCVTGFIYDY